MRGAKILAALAVIAMVKCCFCVVDDPFPARNSLII